MLYYFTDQFKKINDNKYLLLLIKEKLNIDMRLKIKK